MGIGVGITLLVVGGIAAFGVRDQSSAVDLTAIGYICMGVGALAIILALVMNQQRQPARAHTEYVEHRDVGGPPVGLASRPGSEGGLVDVHQGVVGRLGDRALGGELRQDRARRRSDAAATLPS